MGRFLGVTLFFSQAWLAGLGQLAAADDAAAKATDASASEPGLEDATVADLEAAAQGRMEGMDQATDAILVLDLRASGVSQDEAAYLTRALAGVLSQKSPDRVVSTEDINQLASLSKQASAFGCNDDLSCMADLSRVANASRVVSGSLGRVGDSLVLNLTLIDMIEMKSIGSGHLSGRTIDDLQQDLGAVLDEVFGWQGDQAARPHFSLSQGREVSLAIFDVEPSGIDLEIADNLTQILAVELKGIEGTSVISRADIASMLALEAQKEQFDCADAACFAEIGGALGVDKLVVGNVGLIGQRYVISLRLIDVQKVIVDNRVSESFVGQADQLVAAVRAAGRALLGVESTKPGRLIIAANAQGVAVFLNNEAKGELPQPPIDGLPPGRYTLRLSKPDYFEWKSDIYIEPGDTSAVWANMEEMPGTWGLWFMLGGGLNFPLRDDTPFNSGANLEVPFDEKTPMSGSFTGQVWGSGAVFWEHGFRASAALEYHARSLNQLAVGGGLDWCLNWTDYFGFINLCPVTTRYLFVLPGPDLGSFRNGNFIFRAGSRAEFSGESVIMALGISYGIEQYHRIEQDLLVGLISVEALIGLQL